MIDVVTLLVGVGLGVVMLLAVEVAHGWLVAGVRWLAWRRERG